MDETTRIALVGIGAPLVLAGAGTLVAHRVPRAGLAGAIAAGALALAWTCSLIGVQGDWIAGMASSDARLQIAGAALVPIGAIIALVLSPKLARGGFTIVLAGALACGLSALVLSSNGLTTLGKAMLLPDSLAMAVALVACLLWAGAGALTMLISLEQSRRISTSILLTGVAIAVGAGLLGTGSVKLGQYGFGVGAMAAGVMIATLIARGRTLAPIVAVLLPAILATLISSGVAFSSTPIWVWALLGVAPVAGFVIENVALSRANDRIRALARIGVAALIAGVAVAPGIIELAKFAAGKSDDPYSNYK
jgi:hypothetical protein